MISSVLEWYCHQCHKELMTRPDILPLLFQRGLSMEYIIKSKLGYITLAINLEAMHIFGFEVMKQNGFLTKDSTPSKFEFQFEHRLMIPLFGLNNEILAFTARIMREPKKYITSAGVNQHEILSGLQDFAGDNVILVEGPIDKILANQYGFKNVLSINGNSITLNQAKSMPRNNLILALDGDKGGQQAVSDLLTNLVTWIRKGQIPRFNIKVAILPNLDPAELIKQDVALFKEVIDNSIPIIDFYIQTFKQANGFENFKAKQKRGLVLNAVKVLLTLSDNLEKDIEQFSKEFDLSVEDIENMIQKYLEREKRHSLLT